MQEPLEERPVAARRTGGREVHRSLVGSVRILLVALCAVPLLLVILSTAILGFGALSREGTILLLAFAIVAAIGLALLHWDHIGSAVTLVTIAVLAGLAWETAVTGIIGFSVFLFAYSIPIAFAALIVGRRALITTTLAAVAAVVAVHLLEREGVSWIAYDIDLPMPGVVVISFALIATFLALVLERFGVELKIAHDAALGREAEQARLVGQLESQIEERKQVEIEREAAERERERLFELERLARQRAENVSAKLSFLAEASHLLATTLDLEETLRRLTDLLVPRWANWCSIHLTGDDGELRPFTIAHRDRRRADWAMNVREKFQIQEGRLSAVTAVRTGKTQHLARVDDEDLTAAAQDEDHLEVLRKVRFRSSVIVPFIVRDSAIGALTLVSSEEERTYTEDDVVFFEELAARAAIAIDNSRLFEQTRRLNRGLEERVEQRTAELQYALSELETFAYNISHDLRTPLRGIDGFSQSLLDDYGDKLDRDGVRALGRIRQGASKMGQLIDALLTLSNLSRAELEVEEVDLSEMAEELVSELRRGGPLRTVEVTIEPHMKVKGDWDLLRRALLALIDNAWKFTRGRERGRVQIGMLERDEETVYFVRDNGVGFDMAYYDKLFSPFQRLHPQAFEGTGVGLALAQRVLIRHHGRIWAEAEEGQGATFYFTIRT